jgi:hypothetical protein
MTEQPNTHGGTGRGQGRKPVVDKKITLSIYPQQSRIDAIGKDRAKAIAIEAIEKEYKKIANQKQ